ncbi:hypothetical protein PFISCL1PPCAC_23654 [Pristionchus fissidentatus]|uniref:G protein-coupled receptor n=1 Tax=Pristionchus fissidentatus TaxID=1538716 RepID=A0AAV5WMV0_9BILA|nr:hypothetical protein PFISCL1PPCAC_23654 [Pristionchus fissidentatus]
MIFCTSCDRRFDQISYKLDDEVTRRSLTNVPQREWRQFSLAVNAHLLFASLLFISGCVCFCISLQFSTQFDAVNCSDGVNIFPPMLNMMGAFTGLFTLRTLHLKWPAFVHFLSCVIVVPLNLLTAVDLIANSFHWDNYWSRYPSVTPVFEIEGHETIDWTSSFLWMDVSIGIVALINVIIYIYFKYWYSIRSNNP